MSDEKLSWEQRAEHAEAVLDEVRRQRDEAKKRSAVQQWNGECIGRVEQILGGLLDSDGLTEHEPWEAGWPVEDAAARVVAQRDAAYKLLADIRPMLADLDIIAELRGIGPDAGHLLQRIDALIGSQVPERRAGLRSDRHD